jgi:hypothetical protein
MVSGWRIEAQAQTVSEAIPQYAEEMEINENVVKN